MDRKHNTTHIHIDGKSGIEVINANLSRMRDEGCSLVRELRWSDGVCGRGGSSMWTEVMDRRREGGGLFREWFQWTQIRLSSAAWPPLTWMIPVVMETGKTSVTLFCFFLPVSEGWKWMWPQDQHAAILAKNQYFPPLSCIGPASCNISIHTWAQSALILPGCVCCVRFCACEGREKCCLEQKLASVFELLH